MLFLDTTMLAEYDLLHVFTYPSTDTPLHL